MSVRGPHLAPSRRLPTELDVGAQRVQLVGVAERHGDLLDAPSMRVRARAAARPAVARADRVLDAAQLPVPAEDARAHAELVERRHRARQRNQHRDRTTPAPATCGRSGWRARTAGSAAAAARRSGRSAALPSPAAARCCARSGSRPCAGTSRRRRAPLRRPARTAGSAPDAVASRATSDAVGRDQPHVLRRHVLRQVDDAAGQHDRAQERKAARVGIGLRKVEQAGCPGVCSSIWTISDSGAEANTSASISPASSAITAGVCSSREQRQRAAARWRFASIIRSIRFGTPLPRRADVQAPARELRRGSSASARFSRRCAESLR